MRISKLFISYILLCLPMTANSQIIETTNLEQISKDYRAFSANYSPKDILVIFGVQNAIFHPFFPSFRLLDNKAFNQLSKIFNAIKSSQMTYFDTLVLTEGSNTLSDPALPNIIKDMQEQGSQVIAIDNGLTGNFNNIQKLEIWKADYLKSLNINLSQAFPLQEYLILNNLEAFDNSYPVFYQGILSSNNLPLFQVLLNFLIEVKCTPTVLIMVSRDFIELQGVEQQLKNYNDKLVFIGYHLSQQSQEASEINENNFVQLVEGLAKKLKLVKRNNPKIKSKARINPYDTKK